MFDHWGITPPRDNISMQTISGKIKWDYLWKIIQQKKLISKFSKLCPNRSNPCPVTGGIIATLAKIFCVLLQLCAVNLQENAREAKYWQEMAFGKVKT